MDKRVKFKKSYNSDDILDEIYPGPIEGVYTPQPMDARITPQYDDDSPIVGRISSARPKSRLRTSGRPQSRLDVGVQDFYNTPPIHTEKKSRPQISETQYNYAIPDESIRPTSPVQRLLNRWHTQPNMSMQGPPPGSQMDPITRQYYHRVWSSKNLPSTSNDVHLNRYGRAGGVWRHVRACVANTGTQLAFIDGTVKEEDNVFFPPWKSANTSLQRRASFTAYNSQPNQISANFIPPTQKHLPPRSAKYRNKYHTHAKEGLKYWYQEPKPIDYSAKYCFGARSRWMGVPGESLHPLPV
ncbi:uncharacterized protein LOC132724059 isoform X4 [Ruditapes philippinarum]|uniref:uncharacterized protein LOC132724059 isoform X4 n=1 Tax=Ruditapes philippinarum TaxID=129788 RepID=UPI00295BB33F|nr:uncharacterized protein LOC132724059 isoform X4 [Ruditapes philippinarum]